MKTLLISLLLQQTSPTKCEGQTKCVEWRYNTKTVCTKDDDHPIGGGVIGWLVCRPLCGLGGALLGSSDKQTCHEEREANPVCTKYESIKP